MSSDELSGRLEALVDHLRWHRDRPVTLSEIAAVTEVLIASMSSYFKSIDVSIYKEFRYLSDYITRARDEISQLHPVELKTRQIPRAGRELDAIVTATEEATNSIMEAAETIMAADSSDLEEYKAIVNDNVMSIFEACSFQDITGQRISKVIETLSVIEQRLHRLGEVWGVEVDEGPIEDQLYESFDEPTMSGPALGDEGIDQEGVDALLSESTKEEDEEFVAASDDDDTYSLGETQLSEKDVGRLMGAHGPANDFHPTQDTEYRTAEQLTRAVASLLREEAEEEGLVDRTGHDLVKEAINDDEPILQPRKERPAAAGSKIRTTQADIDALFK